MQWLGRLVSEHKELPPEFVYHEDINMYELIPLTWKEGQKWRQLKDNSGHIIVLSSEGEVYEFKFAYPSAVYQLWMGDAPSEIMTGTSHAPGPNFQVKVTRSSGSNNYILESQRFVSKNIYKYILCTDKTGRASVFRRVDEPST